MALGWSWGVRGCSTSWGGLATLPHCGGVDIVATTNSCAQYPARLLLYDRRFPRSQVYVEHIFLLSCRDPNPPCLPPVLYPNPANYSPQHITSPPPSNRPNRHLSWIALGLSSRDHRAGEGGDYASPIQRNSPRPFYFTIWTYYFPQQYISTHEPPIRLPIPAPTKPTPHAPFPSPQTSTTKLFLLTTPPTS